MADKPETELPEYPKNAEEAKQLMQQMTDWENQTLADGTN